MPLRVLICGSREWEHRHPISAVVHGLMVLDPELEVVHGAARGADRIAGDCARATGAKETPVRAKWRLYHEAAGPIRNQEMIDEHRPDVVYAFRCSGKSTGTDDMIQRAKDAGIPVFVIREG